MRLITALLASAFALGATAGEAQLLPAGEFKARDGRPGPGKTWRISDAEGQALAARITETAALTPIVIDYEHQTIRAKENGRPAPAAGWILSAEWRPGKGLFAKVDWTPAARQRISDKEYAFISPVIDSDDDTGQVHNVVLAALVNHPALLGMEPVLAQLSTQFHQEHSMNLLAALIAALKLPAEAKETDVVAAVTTLAAQPPKTAVPHALATELRLQPGADEAAVLAAVRALKTPDTATLQAMTALQGEIATLRAQLEGDKLTGLVDSAIKANKLLPAQRDWALNFGKKDLAALQGFIDAAPAIPGLNGQTDGKSHDLGKTGLHALTTEQLSIATQLGLDPAKYAEQLKAAA